MRSWKPRPPSPELEERIFRAEGDETAAAIDWTGLLRWLAPALACLLLMAVITARTPHFAQLTRTDPANLLAPGYAAYIMASFHSEQNGIGPNSFESTNPAGPHSSIGSFILMNTNGLLR